MPYLPYLEIPHPGDMEGVQKLYAFEGKRHGASVVQTPFTYGGPEGLWELAVIEFKDRIAEEPWSLCHETTVTDDVIGWLTEPQVQEVLEQIAQQDDGHTDKES